MDFWVPGQVDIYPFSGYSRGQNRWASSLTCVLSSLNTDNVIVTRDLGHIRLAYSLAHNLDIRHIMRPTTPGFGGGTLKLILQLHVVCEDIQCSEPLTFLIPPMGAFMTSLAGCGSTCVSLLYMLAKRKFHGSVDHLEFLLCCEDDTGRPAYDQCHVLRVR